MRKVCFGVVALLLMLGVAVAKPVTKDHAEGIRFDVPDNWELAELDAPKPWSGKMWVIVAGKSKTGDPEVAFLIISTKAGKLEESIKDLEKLVAATTKDVKWSKPVSNKLGGMNALLIEGEGKDGKTKATLELGVVVLEAPSKKAVIILGAADKAAKPKYKAGIEAMLKSIRKTKK